LRNLIAAIDRIDPLTVCGRVAAVNGLLIEAKGGLARLSVGARADIVRGQGLTPLATEVVGFRENRALLMPFGPVDGVAPGAEHMCKSLRPGFRGRHVAHRQHGNVPPWPMRQARQRVGAGEQKSLDAHGQGFAVGDDVQHGCQDGRVAECRQPFAGRRGVRHGPRHQHAGSVKDQTGRPGWRP